MITKTFCLSFLVASLAPAAQVDLVKLGKQTFDAVGCAECHAIAKNDDSVKTGPGLFGLFTTTPREREILETAEEHKIKLKADLEYFKKSIRKPAEDLAIAETGLEAAIRELHEETTVVARPIGYLTNVDVIQRDADGALQFHYLLAAVLCDFVSGVPTAGDDASDARWFPVDHVLSGDLATSRNVGTVLRRAITA